MLPTLEKNMGLPVYVIITPVRNEVRHLEDTIRSVVSQTIQPQKWVIVDDGSTDGTGACVDVAARQHPWIHVIHRQDRGFRKSGGGVVEAFYDGYHLIERDSWDYLVKLDGDLLFEQDYFKRCFDCFASNPKLGIGGGTICFKSQDALVEEAKGDPPFHVRGATKIYRRACWEQLGGLTKAPGWDTVDELKANMLGWRTYTLKELKLLHQKSTGAADGSWKNWLKNGRANYITGYHPFFMALKCVKRLTQKPYILAAVGLAVGFTSGYVKHLPRINDERLISWVRNQQIRRLCFRDSIWG